MMTMTKKRNRLFIYLFFSIMLLSLVSASDLSCEMKEHYYLNGIVQNIYGERNFDGLSFDVFCTNNLEKTRILSLSITNCSPQDLCKSFEGIKNVDFIRIKQTLNLFNSKIIDVSKINDSTEQNYSIEITGLNEDNLSFEKAQTSKNILIKNRGGNIIYDIGSFIFPSSPSWGFGLFIIGIFFIFFYLWKNETIKKVTDWRARKRRIKLESGKGNYYENH